MLKRIACIGLCGLLALPSPGHAAAQENWLTHGGDTDETHYSPLNAINTKTIGRLGLAWSLDIPHEAALAAVPLAIDGVLYFSGDHAAIYAVDALSGKLLWKFDPETWKTNPDAFAWHYATNHGVAYADGRVFVSAMDGRLFAVDAKTGKRLWDVATLPPGERRFMHGAPRVFNGKVVIGNSGDPGGKRGYVTAYDAATGKQEWRFYITPGAPEENESDPVMKRAAATWAGEFWKNGTGGGAWYSIVFDSALNQIYLATSDPSGRRPDVNDPAGGDNLFTDSIVALNADTGKYVWHYQLNPHDIWDFDATQQMTLADIKIAGKSRKVLMQAPKNGFFYVFDRKTGKLISADKFAKVTWAERIDLKTGRPVDAPHIREAGMDVWPGPNGAHSWQAMAFSPKTGMAYIPTMQQGVHFGRLGTGTGLAVVPDPRDGMGTLLAWDVLHHKRAWEVPYNEYFNGGALATAGGVVFHNTAKGYVIAYDATTGRQLWQFYAGVGIVSAPISYSVDGKQYISVLAGYGTSAAVAGAAHVGWRYSAQRRLLTFALDGTAALESVDYPDLLPHAVDDPSVKINPDDVAAGARLYGRCTICHGSGLVSNGAAPDLRESQFALNSESMWSVLHEGVLLPYGMPRFDALTRDEVRQLYAYIRDSARKAIVAAGSKPSRRNDDKVR